MSPSWRLTHCNKLNYCNFQAKKEQKFDFFSERSFFLFHSWTPKAVFLLVASPLVKILLLFFIRWNKNRSYTEKVKYPLCSSNCIYVRRYTRSSREWIISRTDGQTMVQLFYITLISVDTAQQEMFRSKVCYYWPRWYEHDIPMLVCHTYPCKNQWHHIKMVLCCCLLRNHSCKGMLYI